MKNNKRANNSPVNSSPLRAFGSKSRRPVPPSLLKEKGDFRGLSSNNGGSEFLLVNLISVLSMTQATPRSPLQQPTPHFHPETLCPPHRSDVVDARSR